MSERRPADLAARLAGLSPQKQALLARKLAERSTARGSDAADRIPPRDEGPAPLSHAQEMLWLHEQMTPGTATYNVAMTRRIRGSLDLGAMQTALDALVARHGALRTTIDERDGAPVQSVEAARPVPLVVHDVRALDADARETAATETLRAIVARPFDLSQGTWPHAAIVRVSNDETLLSLVVHHVVCDGASTGILMRDFAALYSSAASGDVASLAPLPIEMADYAAWQRKTVVDERLSPSVAWWREHLAGASAEIELPTDAPRTTATSGPGARHAQVISTVDAAAVRALAASNGTTPFNVLLAAFSALLHRYSGQDDLVVGTVVAGRDRAETTALVGYLANTLAIRARFRAETTFAQLVHRVRDDLVQAFRHRDVPYERLARESATARSSELFRVLFAMQDASGPAVRFGAATAEPLGVDVGAAKFDLTLSVTERADGYRVAVEYRCDLFGQSTIARLVTHFGELLRDAIARPGARVAELSLLPEAEREQLARWNATAVAYPADETLVTLLDEQAARTPNAVAVADERRAMTYAELDAAATALARRLRRAGVARGALVGVCAERSVALVVALVAVLKAGAAYVPIDPEYPADRIAYMLDDAAVRVLLTSRALVDALAPVRTTSGSVLLLDDTIDAPDASLDDVALVPPAADDPAYIIYTSGSTGRPKGAVNAHRGIVNRLRWMQDTYALGAGDVALQKTPFSFDVSVWEFFWPLMTGAKLVMARPGGHRDASYLAEAIGTQGVTVCHFVPSMLRAFLADAGAPRCTTLRDVMASGEALSPDLVAAFYETLPATRLHNLYGPTECAVDVTFWPCPPSAVPPAIVPIGRPVSNARVYVLDAERQQMPIGLPGELYLAGVQVGVGYHGRPELTAERFVRDPFATSPDARMYRTGDRGRWRDDGTVEYLGRLDFQVKVRGFRIELGEIESVLLQHPAIAHAVVVARPLWDGGDPQLVAYYVPRTDIDMATLHEHLARRVPDYMVPAAFMPLAELPLGTSGKVDRRALPAPVADVPAERYVAPRDDVETVVASLWSAALGRERVSVDASFFALGGHSLVATRLTGQISKIFRTPLPLRRFFATPTVEGVARAIVEQEPKAGQAALIARLFLKAREMTAQRAAAAESS